MVKGGEDEQIKMKLSEHILQERVPHVNRVDYQLLDITEDGFVSLFTDNGETKDDIKLPSDDALAKQMAYSSQMFGSQHCYSLVHGQP